MDYIYMSEQGYNDLKNELEHLKSVERPRVINDIATAREKGDLSENAEYHAAKDEQAHLEDKILKLEDSFARARIMDNSKIDTSKAIMLSNVTIKNVKTGMEITYQLVSHAEANVKMKKISVDSPIGKGLLGTKVGDVVDIKIPSGIIEFEVIGLSHS